MSKPAVPSTGWKASCAAREVPASLPYGKSLVTASGDAIFRLWDGVTGKPLKEFAGRAVPVAFSEDGKTLAVSHRWSGVGLLCGIRQRLR